MRIFYKNDFEIVASLRDATGKQVPFPECDWEAKFHTDIRDYEYSAKRVNGKYINCFQDPNGFMHFVFNNHCLGTGRLVWELHVLLPNKNFSDGFQDLYSNQCLNVELVNTQSHISESAQIETVLPFYNREVIRQSFTSNVIPFITRGRMRTGCKPGFAYLYFDKNQNYHGVLISEIQNIDKYNYRYALPFTTSIAKAFPDGKFEGNDIVVNFRNCTGTYNRNSGEITISEISDDWNPKGAGGADVLCDINLQLGEADTFMRWLCLTTTKEGKVVRANVAQPARYDTKLDIDCWNLSGELIYSMYNASRNGAFKRYVHCSVQTANKSCFKVEVQRKKVRGSSMRCRNRITYWSKIKIMPKFGVIRARLCIDSKKKSGWKYYSFAITNTGRIFFNRLG